VRSARTRALTILGRPTSFLDYLRRFPIDVIKLDPSFTDTASMSPASLKGPPLRQGAFYR